MKFFNLIQKKNEFKKYIETALQQKGSKAISDKRESLAKEKNA